MKGGGDIRMMQCATYNLQQNIQNATIGWIFGTEKTK